MYDGRHSIANVLKLPHPAMMKALTHSPLFVPDCPLLSSMKKTNDLSGAGVTDYLRVANE
jgi:hypothetical protein